MKNFLALIVLVIVLALAWAGYAWYTSSQKIAQIDSFEECVAAGFPVMESYPRQCTANGKTFAEDIQEPEEQEPEEEEPEPSSNDIQVSAPSSNAQIQSPLTVTGQAKGPWYFEASFPIILLDGNNNQIAQTNAQATSDWMTTNFVPFTATLTFSTPSTPTGTLVLKKSNPSGEPQNDDQITIPVTF